jgi:hypothetical protein
MAFTTLSLGLTLTIPTNGTKNWGTTLLNTTWTKISNHKHTGSGDGNQLVTASYAADSVTDAKLRLANAGWLRARNAAGSADKNLIRLNASDQGEIGVLVGQLQKAAALAPAGNTQSIEWKDGNIQTLDLGSASGDVTLTLLNPVQGARLRLHVIQGATPRDVIWPAAVKWPGGQKLILSQTNDAVDVVELYWDGTNYFGTWEVDFQ